MRLGDEIVNLGGLLIQAYGFHFHSINRKFSVLFLYFISFSCLGFVSLMLVFDLFSLNA